MPEVGSKIAYAFAASIAPANANSWPAGMEIDVAIGPPDRWSIEYRCQPDWISAVRCRVTTCPRRIVFPGGSLNDQAIGFGTEAACVASSNPMTTFITETTPA